MAGSQGWKRQTVRFLLISSFLALAYGDQKLERWLAWPRLFNRSRTSFAIRSRWLNSPPINMVKVKLNSPFSATRELTCISGSADRALQWAGMATDRFR